MGLKLTKEQQNCPYCHTDANGRPLKYLKNNDDCRVGLAKSELQIVTLKGYTTPSMAPDINYCPKCGRVLQEEVMSREEQCFECNGTVTLNSGDTLLSIFFDDKERKNFMLLRHDDYRFRYNLLFEFCPYCGRPLNEEEE